MFTIINDLFEKNKKRIKFINQYFTNDFSNIQKIYEDTIKSLNSFYNNLSTQMQLNVEYNEEIQNNTNINININAIKEIRLLNESGYSDKKQNFLDKIYTTFNVNYCEKYINSDIVNINDTIIKLFTNFSFFSCYKTCSENEDGENFRIFTYFIEKNVIIYENVRFIDKICLISDSKDIKYIIFNIFGKIIRTNCTVNLLSKIIIKNIIYYNMFRKIVYHENFNYFFSRQQIKQIIYDENTYKIIFKFYFTFYYQKYININHKRANILKKTYLDIKTYQNIKHNFLIFMILLKILKTVKNNKTIQYLSQIFCNNILKLNFVNREIVSNFINSMYDYLNSKYNFENIFIEKKEMIRVELEDNEFIKKNKSEHNINLMYFDYNKLNQLDSRDIELKEKVKSNIKSTNNYLNLENITFSYRIIEILSTNLFNLIDNELIQSNDVFVDILIYLKIIYENIINDEELIKFYSQKENFINISIHVLTIILEDFVNLKYYFVDDIDILELIKKFYNDNNKI
jgi:hypothetical protein